MCFREIERRYVAQPSSDARQRVPTECVQGSTARFEIVETVHAPVPVLKAKKKARAVSPGLLIRASLPSAPTNVLRRRMKMNRRFLERRGVH
jgi:hypothetical protein